MKTSPVREDEQGIYVVTNGSIYRPGDIAGYSHACDMSDGNLKKGDRVIVRHVSGTPTARIIIPYTEDYELRWGNDYLHEQQALYDSADRNSIPNIFDSLVVVTRYEK